MCGRHCPLQAAGRCSSLQRRWVRPRRRRRLPCWQLCRCHQGLQQLRRSLLPQQPCRCRHGWQRLCRRWQGLQQQQRQQVRRRHLQHPRWCWSSQFRLRQYRCRCRSPWAVCCPGLCPLGQCSRRLPDRRLLCLGSPQQRRLQHLPAAQRWAAIWPRRSLQACHLQRSRCWRLAPGCRSAGTLAACCTCAALGAAATPQRPALPSTRRAARKQVSTLLESAVACTVLTALPSDPALMCIPFCCAARVFPAAIRGGG